MLIYIASPYTATAKQLEAVPEPRREAEARAIRNARFELACAAQAELLNAGMHPIGPIVSSHPIAVAYDLPKDFRFWLDLNHKLIDACAEVWVLCLEGWDESAGVADEIAYARSTSKTIRYVDPLDVTAPLRDAPAPAHAPPAAPSSNPNPKDAIGVHKASLSKFPAVALAHGAHAMMNGADKYGAFNWRGHPVIASIYVDACARHVAAWFDREALAEDSGVHHLGHALACLAILLDAEATGNLVDDRPTGGAFPRVLAEINAAIKARRAPAPALAHKCEGYCCATCKHMEKGHNDKPCVECIHTSLLAPGERQCLWEAP